MKTGLTLVLSAFLAGACAADLPANTGSVGSAELSLSLPDSTTLASIDYRVKRSGYESTGSVPLDDSQEITFQVGGIPAASGYAITLKGTTSQGTECFAGPVSFDITEAVTAVIRLKLVCGARSSGSNTGTARIDVSVDQGDECPIIDGLTALPSSTKVGRKIELVAYSSAAHAKYEWSASPDGCGTFTVRDDARTEFKCKSEGKHTVTVTVKGKKSCRASETIEVICTDDDPSERDAGVRPASEVTQVDIAVTNVTASVYTDGRYDVTFIPRTSAGTALLDPDKLDVAIEITAPSGQTSMIISKTCNTPMGGGLSVGVIIDDSGSMSSSDPQLLRRDAVVAFLNRLTADAEVLLTDYGAAGSNLRDLVCADSAAGGTCAPAAASGFTTDIEKLKASVDQIVANGGTPLYQSCRDMVPLVASRTGRDQAILLLSDGAPSDVGLRMMCLDAASGAMIPVYTIGLGPAAEGGTGSSPAAVMVLREIASTTNAGYGSAAMPSLLEDLFMQIGAVTSDGSCTVTGIFGSYQSLPRNTPVTGTLKVGTTASGMFGFTTPP